MASIYGMNENMDLNIGHILSKLDALKIRKNTIVIFLSDNGPNTARYNGGMKGKKGTVDEGGTRVPFYISWPEVIHPGTTAQLAQGIDLLPSLLKICNIKNNPVLPVDGKDLSKIILKGAKPFDRYIYSRQGSYPLNGLSGSVRNNQYRLVITRKDTTLYDMLNDPSQQKNLADIKPEIRNNLTRVYRKWEKELIENYSPNTTIEAGYKEEKLFTLLVQDAILSGKVKRLSIHPNQSHTENWIQNGDSIFWNLNMVSTGKYRVELKYGCDRENIGSLFSFHSTSDSFQFILNQPFDSNILPDIDYVPRTESVERTWTWTQIGEINLK